MRVLVYKRTHTGDPDEKTGTFGCNGCMGAVRGREFDAVIGVGGIGPKAKKNGIAGKLTWIGQGPRHVPVRDKRAPGVRFSHFVLYETAGEALEEISPKLAKRIYDVGVRAVVLGPDDAEYAEIKRLLKRAKAVKASPGLKTTARGSCSVSKCEQPRRRKGVC